MLMPDIERAIRTCLDVEAMRVHLQPLLDAQGAIAAVRIGKTRRSASRLRHPHPLTLSYEVDVGATAERPARTLHYYGKLCRAGASADAALGTPALHVPELDLLLWPWPADPGLPQLAGLLDARATLPIWDAAADDVQLRRYEPERRATLRYAHADGRVLFAKTYGAGLAAAVRSRFVWSWTLSQQCALAPLVARPLADVGGEHTLWQHAATGTPLLQWLDDDRQSPWLQPLAHAIATIHDAPLALAGPTPRDRAHWLTEIGRRRKKIARAMPELAARVEAVAATLERGAEQLPAHDGTVIHGDFHPDQVWFDGARIVLFDFDEFCLGDPMEDLAEFLVKLPPAAAGVQAAVPWIAAYAQIAPQHFCRVRLAWHLAVQQLLQTSRAFVFQVADWRDEVQRRLERTEALAAAVERELLR
jgi:thiamine kinase-like enzyme